MTQIELTPSQRAVIDLAADNNGRLEHFPKNLGGGARAAVVRGLLRADLIVADGAVYALTDAGYQAVDRTPPQASSYADADSEADTGTEADAADETAMTPAEPAQAHTETSDSETEPASDARSGAPNPPKKREQSRVDQVVALLLRPQGVTIKEVMEATSWQQHSVRGFFAGALKKKGYELISDKEGKADRVYRIQTEEEATPEIKSDEEE